MRIYFAVKNISVCVLQQYLSRRYISRRPIKALNHTQREREKGGKQVCLDCNGAVASPLQKKKKWSRMFLLWLRLGYKQTYKKKKTHKRCRVIQHTLSQVLWKKHIFPNSRPGIDFFVLASFPSLTAGSLDSYTIVLLGYLSHGVTRSFSFFKKAAFYRLKYPPCLHFFSSSRVVLRSYPTGFPPSKRVNLLEKETYSSSAPFPHLLILKETK